MWPVISARLGMCAGSSRGTARRLRPRSGTCGRAVGRASVGERWGRGRERGVGRRAAARGGRRGVGGGGGSRRGGGACGGGALRVGGGEGGGGGIGGADGARGGEVA